MVSFSSFSTILPFQCLYSEATCQIKHCLSASFDNVIILKPFSPFVVWCFVMSTLSTVTSLRDRSPLSPPPDLSSPPPQVDRDLLFLPATACQSLGSVLKLSFLILSILNVIYFTCSKKFILNTLQLVFHLKWVLTVFWQVPIEIFSTGKNVFKKKLNPVISCSI